MLLELGDMVYSSVPDLDNQMEWEEGSDFDCHSLDTSLAFFWATGATLEEVEISVQNLVYRAGGRSHRIQFHFHFLTCFFI